MSDTAVETHSQCVQRQITALIQRTDQLRDFVYLICPTITTPLIAVPNCEAPLPDCACTNSDPCSRCGCAPCECVCEASLVSGINVDVPSDLTPDEINTGDINDLQRWATKKDAELAALTDYLQCQEQTLKDLQALVAVLKGQVAAINP